MKISPLLACGLLALSATGCKAPAEDAAATTTTPTSATSDAAPSKATVKNAPDASAAPGAGYRIQPANPNDPHFKADPKLAGGS